MLDISGRGRAMLLGGEPFAEELVMWWNFIGRTHEEIVEFRRVWNDGDGDERRSAPVAWASTATDCPRRRCPALGSSPVAAAADSDLGAGWPPW